MRGTFKVLFLKKKGSEKSNGNLPLMCRLTVNDEIKKFGCKMDVHLRLWDVTLPQPPISPRVPVLFLQ